MSNALVRWNNKMHAFFILLNLEHLEGMKKRGGWILLIYTPQLRYK